MTLKLNSWLAWNNNRLGLESRWRWGIIYTSQLDRSSSDCEVAGSNKGPWLKQRIFVTAG